MFKKTMGMLCLVLLCAVSPARAGFIYQNFEPDNGQPLTVWGTGGAGVSTVGRAEAVHFGRNALKMNSGYFWSGVSVQSQTAAGDVDLKQTNNDRLTFWTYSMPHINCYVYGCEKGTDNTVGVIFYDNGNYKTTGFEVWTVQTALYEQWSKMHILFSQLPPDFDLRHVTRLEFKEYKPGIYYFDDIHAVREDRAYQTFEIGERSGSTDSDYGWKWNDADTAGISAVNPDEPHHEGTHSWKVTTLGKWGGTGIQSQEQKYVVSGGTAQQTFWSVDFAPENNDRLTFWFYNQSQNGSDNNMGVQFYDNGAHSTDDTKVAVWPKQGATYNGWTRMTVLFSDVLKAAPDFNLHDVNKIQFQNYWAGTVYIDDIRAAGPQPVLKAGAFAQGVVQWDPVQGAVNYRLQESRDGPDGPWQTIYSGPALSYQTKRLSRSWLRVRWEEGFTDRNAIPYYSDWSDVVPYTAPYVSLDFAALRNGQLIWNAIPQAASYVVQYAPTKFGPWSQLYKGAPPQTPLSANAGTWYRVHAVAESGGAVVDVGPWSRPQSYVAGRGFVKAAGTVIKDADGTGDTLTLNGVNLGGAFLIEPWMTGIGQGDSPALIDDWSIRNALNTRFGVAAANSLLKTYQGAYLNTDDYNLLLDRGVTLARLPFYYRMLQDDNGNWILNASGQIDFAALDAVVNALADRGIYVVLDLHGAPGYQNADPNSGRGNINLLFGTNDVYRARTVSLWTEIARHYKDNPWVLGYDLLNEPVGAAPNSTALADLYDRLYQAIRGVDANHMVIMEGIWFTDPADPAHKRQVVDWDTLPNPSSRGWTNVMYQFHFYHWSDEDGNGNAVNADENFDGHKAFIDQKIAEAAIKQPQYNVPVMIGEFYGFGLGSIWDYYIKAFNAQHWSWTSWTYKYHDSPSNWGMVYHAGYDEALPNLRNDYLADLTRKLGKYTTADYHQRNATITGLIASSAASVAPVPVNQPYITTSGTIFLAPGADFTIEGHNFGDASESHSIVYGGSSLPIISWSDTQVHAYIRSTEPFGSGTINVVTPLGTSNGVDTIIQGPGTGEPGAPPPVVDPANGDFSFTGHFSDTPGTVQFYPAPCSDIPPGTHPCNNGDAAITIWTPTLIQGWVPPDALLTGERYNIRGIEGGPLYPVMMRMNNRPPVLSVVANKTIAVNGQLTITLSGSDPDGDALGYAVVPLPAGASITGNVFRWTPTYDQAGPHTLTFQVSDGQAAAQRTAVVTVTWNPADIAVTSVTPLAASVTAGSGFSATATVAGQNNVSAAGTFTGFYLSKDQVLNTAQDVAVSGGFGTGTIAGYGTFTGTATAAVPAAAPAGDYYLCARADDRNTLIEPDEANNGLCGSAKITVLPLTKGNVDGIIGGNALAGWACAYGVETPIAVKLYRNGLPGAGGVLIGQYAADQTAEAGVGAACGTPAQNAHRFKILLDSALAPYVGQGLYVVPEGGSALANSGKYTIPSSVAVIVRGYVDGIYTVGGRSYLRGWACNYGSNTQIPVALYRNGPPGSGVVIGQYQANRAAEAGVGAACGTPAQSNHRFDILLDSAALSPYAGQALYVSTVGTNPVSLPNSGKYTIPPPVQLGYVDGVIKQGGQNLLAGWSCIYGQSAPVSVKVYRNGLPGAGGVLIGQYLADASAEAGVANACGTPSQPNHRFRIVLDASLAAYAGQPVYVVAVDGSPGLALPNSGKYTLP